MRDLLAFVKLLTEKKTRLGAQELFAFEKIVEKLNFYNIKYEVQRFENFYPKEIKSFLEADGEKIECENTGFVSGIIDGKSLILAQDFESDFSDIINKSNINYNPNSNEISRIAFYNNPSVAISKRNKEKVKMASKLLGLTEVEKASFESANILVGNLDVPENIIFIHYDSVGMGVIDNACAVAVALGLIIENVEILKNNLFIFSGSEEISYDWPFYWGRGYRVFEEKYYNILKNTRKIIVVDGIGNGEEKFLSDNDLIKQAIPLENLKEFENKILILTGDFDDLMKYYHSPADNIKKIKEGSLEKTKQMLIDKIC